MSRWNRSFLVVSLLAALTVGVSCSTSESPVAPSVEPSASLIGTVLSVTDLLTCRAQPYAVVTQQVGPSGGTLVVGEHRLVIPRGALSRTVVIKGEQLPGSVNSVRFSPEGLRFATPAQLTMSYRNCLVVLLPKRIAYTTELLKVLRLLPSRDLFGPKTVTSPLDHFSRYVVAY
jgi:hypothetical protein